MAGLGKKKDRLDLKIGKSAGEKAFNKKAESYEAIDVGEIAQIDADRANEEQRKRVAKKAKSGKKKAEKELGKKIPDKELAAMSDSEFLLRNK